MFNTSQQELYFLFILTKLKGFQHLVAYSSENLGTFLLHFIRTSLMPNDVWDLLIHSLLFIFVSPFVRCLFHVLFIFKSILCLYYLVVEILYKRAFQNASHTNVTLHCSSFIWQWFILMSRIPKLVMNFISLIDYLLYKKTFAVQS